METTSTASAGIPRVDTHLAKFSQACTVVLTGVAFLLQQPVIVPITVIVLALAKLHDSHVGGVVLLEHHHVCALLGDLSRLVGNQHGIFHRREH